MVIGTVSRAPKEHGNPIYNSAVLVVDGRIEAIGEPAELKDRFGVHWQIVPKTLPRLIRSGGPQTAQSVFEALMTMKKIDIAGLEAAAREAA